MLVKHVTVRYRGGQTYYSSDGWVVSVIFRDISGSVISGHESVIQDFVSRLNSNKIPSKTYKNNILILKSTPGLFCCVFVASQSSQKPF